LTQYQNECYEVLYDHFTGKTAQVVKNQKERFELLKEAESLVSQKYGITQRLKEIQERLNELDGDTFIQLDLFKAPTHYQLED
jgi:hypothetical protein